MNYLFPEVPQDKIVHFSCGHIIPPSNLSTITLDQGPSGKNLIFNFESRQDVQLVNLFRFFPKQSTQLIL